METTDTTETTATDTWQNRAAKLARLRMVMAQMEASKIAITPRCFSRSKAAIGLTSWHRRSKSEALLRRDLPQAVSLPDGPRDQPPPKRSQLHCGDEPIATLTAPIQACRGRAPVPLDEGAALTRYKMPGVRWYRLRRRARPKKARYLAFPQPYCSGRF
jgi:hypothetical protein